jgi:hypothetical protein
LDVPVDLYQGQKITRRTLELGDFVFWDARVAEN